MTTTRLPHLLTVRQCVEAVGGTVSYRTLYREIEKGNLRARRIGRCLRVSETELRRWIEHGGEAEAS